MLKWKNDVHLYLSRIEASDKSEEQVVEFPSRDLLRNLSVSLSHFPDFVLLQVIYLI